MDNRPRINYIEENNKTEIIISSDKNWFLVIVFTPFILIWLFVEIFVMPNFIFKNEFIFWCCGWTVGGLFMI